jgi:hypothetical protein
MPLLQTENLVIYYQKIWYVCDQPVTLQALLCWGWRLGALTSRRHTLWDSYLRSLVIYITISWFLSFVRPC